MSCITINKLGVHNIQCWNNAAIGLTGYLINNDSVNYKNVDQHITIKSDRKVKAFYGTGPGMDFEETPVIILRNNGKSWNVYWLVVYGQDDYALQHEKHEVEISSNADQKSIVNMTIIPEEGVFKVW